MNRSICWCLNALRPLFALLANPTSVGRPGCVSPARVRANRVVPANRVLTPVVLVLAVVAAAPGLWAIPPQALSLGTVELGSNTTATATVTFSSSATVTSISVVTTGATGKDFTNAGGGTCTATSYTGGDSCTVVVQFAPLAAGRRVGAIVFKNGSTTVRTYPIYGTGGQAKAYFLGAAATSCSITSKSSASRGIAMDGNGNIYLASEGKGVVSVYSSASCAWVKDIGSGTLSAPAELAFDGAGNLFIADAGLNYAYEATADSNYATVTRLTGVHTSEMGGVAVDAFGNVFVNDWAGSGSTPHQLFKLPVGNYSTSTLIDSTHLGGPQQMAFDAAGNLYIADTGDPHIVEFEAVNGVVTSSSTVDSWGGTSLGDPSGIALDAGGNMYVADCCTNHKILFMPKGCASNACVSTLSTGYSFNTSVYLTPSDTLLVTDANNDLLYQIPLTTAPTGNWPTTTNQGEHDTYDGDLTVTLLSAGSDDIALPVPGSGTNPSFSTASFWLNGGTCPTVSTSGPAGSIAAGTSCTYVVAFTPATTTSITDNMVITDNSSGVSNATQTIALSGTGQTPVPDATTLTVTVSPSSPIYDLGSSIYAAVADTDKPLQTVAGAVTFTATDTTTSTPIVINSGNPVTLVNGVAELDNIAPLGALADSITINASYPGEGMNFEAASNSATVTLVDNSTPTATAPGSSANLGTATVGTTTSATTVTFTFTAPGAIGTPQVVSSGATGGAQPFQDAGTGSCTTRGASYAWGASATCTVNVTFSPKAPGLARGAVNLLDGSGNLLAQAFVYGVGTAGQVAFPYTPITIGTGFASPTALAFDGARNLFTIEGSNVFKYTALSNYNLSSQTTLYTGTPSAIAIDGAGNLIVADSSSGNLTLYYAVGGYANSLPLGGGTFSGVTSIAVDAASNIYFTPGASLEEISPSDYTTANNLTDLVPIQGMVADAAGNLWMASASRDMIIEYNSNNGANPVFTSSNGITYPVGVAIDAAGDIYIADQTAGTLGSFALACQSTPCSTPATLGSYANIAAVANDGQGHLFAAYGNTIVELNGDTAPAVALGSVALGSSGGPDTTTVIQNIGNANLVFAVPGTGTNPSTTTAVFSVDNGTSTCPVLQAGGSTASLAPSLNCFYGLDFTPTTDGAASETVTITDNNLGVSSATQTVAVGGTGTGAAPVPDTTTVSVSATPSSPVAGATTSFTITVADSTNGSNTPTGSVTLTDTVASVVTNLNGGNPVALTSGAATLSGVSLSGAAGTQHTLTATYGGAGFSYGTSTGSVTVTLVLPTATVSNPAITNLGSVAIGSSASATLSFSITGSGAVNSVSVLTSGTTGLDFSAGSPAGTCTSNGANYVYTAPTTCTVKVNFAPIAAGVRAGTVQLLDASGNVLATGYVYGKATEAVLGLVPAAISVLDMSSLGTPLYHPTNLVEDGAGNLYINDLHTDDNGHPYSQIVEVTHSGTVQTLSFGSYTMGHVGGMAVDPSGNLYVTYEYQANDFILKRTPAGTTTQVSTGSYNLTAASGLAADAAGTLYYTDPNNKWILVIPQSGSPSTLPISTSPFNPDNVAVDGDFNVYIVDASDAKIMKYNPNGSTLITLLQTNPSTNNFSQATVGPDGTLYIGDWTTNQVNVLPASLNATILDLTGTSYNNNLSMPMGTAFGLDGTLYIADEGNGRILAYQTAISQSHAMANTFSTATNLDTTDTADGTYFVHLKNTGTASLTATLGAAPADYAVSANTDGSIASCATPSFTLAAGGDCAIGFDFIPTADGSLAETFTLTDNSGGNPSATQTVTLGGTGTGSAPVPDTTTVTVTYNPSSPEAGGGATLTVTVADQTNGSNIPTGSITLTDTVASVVTSLNGGNAITLSGGQATLAGVVLSGTAGTQHTITASYGGVGLSYGTSTGSATVTLAADTAASITAGAAASVGTVTLGSSGSATLTFTLTTGGLVPAIAVLTQGATSADFTDAGTGTCTTNGAAHYYAASSTCTVIVQFAPARAGLRLGAVEIKDGSGNVLAIGYVSGVGSGAQMAYLPAMTTQLSFSDDIQHGYGPADVAVDASGNIFMADNQKQTISKRTSSGTVSTPITLSGSSQPTGIVIDAAGNLIVADQGLHSVSVYAPPYTGAPVVVSSSTVNTGSPAMGTPHTVRVDAAGDLLVTTLDGGTSTHGGLYILTPNGSGGYNAPTQVPTYSSLNQPMGVTVDAAGNLYIADTNNARILVEPAAGSTQSSQETILTGYTTPTGIAVDANADIYLVDSGDEGAFKLTRTGASSWGAATRITTTALIAEAAGLAIDANGSLYIAATAAGSFVELNVSVVPVFNFPTSTLLGGTDTTDFPESVTIENIGNQTLTASAPGISMPTNFAQVAGSGTPADCTTTFSVTAGSGCNLSIEYKPTILSAAIETATLTDNNLGGAPATQTIDLYGVPLAQVSISPASGLVENATYQQSISIAPSVSGGSGTYTFSITGLPLGLSMNSSTGVITGASSAVGTFPLALTVTDSTDPGAGGPSTATVNYTLIITKAEAVFQFSGLTHGYTGSPITPTVTTTPANLDVTLTYNGSATAPTTIGNYTVVATVNDVDWEGQASAQLVISQGTATVALGTLTATYDGAAHAATATTTPASLNVTFTYNGSATVPTAAGSYAVVATINDANFLGTATGTLVIGQATSSIALGSLAATYTGSPLAATATTTPASLAVSFTYNGSQTAPTSAGSYTVVATIGDVNYTGTATGTLVIAKVQSTITLGSLSPTYDGTAHAATATTNPASLAVSFTYNGSATAPTTAGSYAVVATINDSNYQGTASGTLVLAKATGTITFGNLSPTYNGTAHAATVTTTPANLAVSFTYNGSATAPTTAGSYAVAATINDSNYQGTASGTLMIGQATATIALGSLSPAYDGAAHAATAITTPANLAVSFTYNGSATVPTTAGSYAVVATINDSNYQGTASGTLVIGQATATVTLGSLTPTYDGSAHAATAITTPANLAVSFTYNGSATVPTAAGTYAVVATISDSNYQGTATGTLVIAKAQSTITLGNLAASYTGQPIAATATVTPVNLTVHFTYNGSATVPTEVGFYAVVATLNEIDYQGTASGTLVISKANETITFPQPTTPVVLGAGSVTLTATASSSLSVVYSVQSGPATVNSSVLTPTGVGTVVIAADQAGNSDYTAAPTVTRSVQIVSVSLTPSVTSLAFGSQPTTVASQAQTVIVTNPNSFAVPGLTASATGDFAASSNCPAVPALGNCTIGVIFTPTASGARTGTLTINSNYSVMPLTIALSGTGAVAGIQINPATVNFGSQIVNTPSGGAAIAIENTGSADLLISAMAATGDFAVGGNCATVPAGTNCNLTVLFTPTATGTRTGTLTLTDNAGGSAQTQSIQLSGAGTQAGASLSPGVQTFAATLIGTTSSALVATLSNTGTADLTGIASSVLGDFSATTTCAATLSAGASCTYAVSYAPTIAGAEQGTLTVTDNLGSQGVSLVGTGLAPGASLNPSQLLFGGQLAGAASNAQTVIFTNTGSGSVSIGSITAPANFSYTSNCTGSIAPGASCSINVVFAPTTTGALSGNLVLVDTAGTQTVSVSGQGLTAGLAITPSFVLYGAQVEGTVSQAQTLVVTNTGTSTLTLAAPTFSNNFVESDNCAGTLAAGASCSVSVGFAPTATGILSGSLTVQTTNGLLAAVATLSGQGTLPGLTVVPGIVSFGSVSVGATSQAQVVTIWNSGTAPLTISAMSAIGDFSEADTCSGTTLAPGANCVVSVTLTPTTLGMRTGTLQFNDNADGLHQVSLSGMGQQAGASLSVTSLSFGSLPMVAPSQASSASGTSLPISLTNSGAVSLALTSLAVSGDFRAGSNCPAQLAASASCTITVTFVPTSQGHRTGTLTLTDNAGSGIQLVSLAGDGSPIGLKLTPPVLNFGTQTLNVTSAPLTAVLSNNTGQAITQLGINASGEYAETDNCGASLANGTSCTLQVTVTPLTPGAITGSISVSSAGVLVLGAARGVPSAFLKSINPAVNSARALAQSGSNSNSNIGTVAVAATTIHSASTVSQLSFTSLPSATATAGGNAGTVTVVETDSNGAIVSATDTLALTVTGPNGYSQSYTATASAGVASFNLSSVALTSAGSYTYSVVVSGSSGASNGGATGASATEAVSAAVAAKVTPSSGVTQTANMGSAFGSALTVTVTDAYGNPVQGGTVQFTAPASGASALLSGSTATTNAGGIATVTATANTIAGSYTITATAGAATAGAFALSNAKATPTLSLAAIGTPTMLAGAITYTATIASTLGTPSGSIAFMDGAASLGSATVASGKAQLIATTQAAGLHSVTAVYSGDSNFLTLTSSAVAATVLDYTVAVSPAASTTLRAGDSGTFSVTVTPTTGNTLPVATTIALTGLPTGVTAAMSQSGWAQLSSTSWQLAANATLSTTPVVLTIASTVAANRTPTSPRFPTPAPFFVALLLVPFSRRMRRGARRWFALVLLIAAGFGGTLALTGCGGGNGFYAAQPQTSTVTVTVTAGTVTHPTTFTLTIQ